MWECHWDKEVEKKNIGPHIKRRLPNPIPLDPQEAFYGRRTNASCLLYECGEGERIKYVDFTSLYPSINKYGSYPLGHPRVITSNFKDVSDYYGLIRCKVLPPRNPFHPVLPVKVNGSSCFPCARSVQKPTNKRSATMEMRKGCYEAPGFLWNYKRPSRRGRSSRKSNLSGTFLRSPSITGKVHAPSWMLVCLQDT